MEGNKDRKPAESYSGLKMGFPPSGVINCPKPDSKKSHQRGKEKGKG